MKTLEFVRALDSAVADLKAARLAKLLGSHMQGTNRTVSSEEKDEFAELMFQFGYSSQRLAESENEIVTALGLQKFATGPQLGQLVTTFRTAPHGAQLRTDHDFWEFYHALIGALRLSTAVRKLLLES